MSRISPWLLGLLFLGLAVGAMVMPLSSDIVPYAFLFDRNEVKNDQQRFLYAVVEDSGVSKDELQPLLPKLRPLEKQLPVALYIAKESGKPLAEVVELRKSERFWLDVMHKTGLKPAVLFEGVQGKFPEPYKAAWIEYRMKFRPELGDDQIRELVLLQIAHRVSGQPMDEIAKGVSKGKTPQMILAKVKKPSPDASAAPVKASQTTPPPPKAKARAKKGGVRAQ
jgi:hypothetical protein